LAFGQVGEKNDGKDCYHTCTIILEDSDLYIQTLLHIKNSKKYLLILLQIFVISILKS